MSNKIEKNCLNCGEQYLIWPYRSEISKYCSLRCRGKHQPSNSKGKKWSLASRERVKLLHDINGNGSRNYWSLHKWVAYRKGKASSCENCGLNEIKRRYEWSNISGEYKRDLNDYESLCVPCHREKDGNNKLYMFSPLYKKHVFLA